MMFKLILHISDLEKWPTALNNLQNTVQNLTSHHRPFKIVVMANANAIKGYLDPEIRAKISEMTCDQLLFFACQNSLTAQNITQAALNPLNKRPEIAPIEITPTAIIALVEYQNDGFAYVKP